MFWPSLLFICRNIFHALRCSWVLKSKKVAKTVNVNFLNYQERSFRLHIFVEIFSSEFTIFQQLILVSFSSNCEVILRGRLRASIRCSHYKNYRRSNLKLVFKIQSFIQYILYYIIYIKLKFSYLNY